MTKEIKVRIGKEHYFDILHICERYARNFLTITVNEDDIREIKFDIIFLNKNKLVHDLNLAQLLGIKMEIEL